ncbi:MAG TPA: hypothetical protein VF333_06765, partial [Pyrinomonadaceae bacterium]
MMPITPSNASAASRLNHLRSIAKLAALLLVLGTVGGSTVAIQPYPSAGGHAPMALVLKSPAFA